MFRVDCSLPCSSFITSILHICPFFPRQDFGIYFSPPMYIFLTNVYLSNKFVVWVTCGSEKPTFHRSGIDMAGFHNKALLSGNIDTDGGIAMAK